MTAEAAPDRAARVLVVDQAPGLWGAQTYLLRLAGPLAERGVELVLGAPADGDLGREWRARGLPFHEIDLPTQRSVRVDDRGGRLSAAASAREAAALVRNVRAIRRAARDVAADVIWPNVHAVHLDGALAGRLSGVPVVLPMHEEMPYRIGRLLRSAAVLLSTRSVAVSAAVRANLPRVAARHVEVIPNGVDLDRFRPAPADPDVRASLGASQDDVLVVVLTRLDPEKRIEDLLEAAAMLPPDPPWRLAIVGVTSAFPDYAEEVRALGARLLGDRVTFAGRREDVGAVLNAADLLAHAGEIEGTPLVVLEAQACGTPVVAYRMGGVPESVEHGVTGLLADPRDVPGLAAHLRTLVGDPARRSTMGRAGRARVERRHGLAAQIERHAELLTEVARPRRRQGG